MIILFGLKFSSLAEAMALDGYVAEEVFLAVNDLR
jgi:hypothetical protein